MIRFAVAVTPGVPFAGGSTGSIGSIISASRTGMSRLQNTGFNVFTCVS
jgi:hypothetical protein